MAQETGIFSIKRPRETLGGLSHNASAIPLPSSAMKRSNSISHLQAPNTGVRHARSVSGSRMSLAPGRPPNQPQFQRSSSGSNLAEMGYSTAQRTSNIGFTNTNAMFSSTGHRKSYAPVPSTPAPSHPQFQASTQRRSSVYSARQSSSVGQIGHQSFFTTAPVPAVTPRDPRPLRDRAYQMQIGQELLDYLTQNNFEMDMKYSLTQKAMTSPTQKDFNYMFQWLYQRIDPSYRFQKSIDAEVPPILQQLRYPFAKSISKSQIGAVGGANWSTFLGVLHWLMQLARMMEQFNSGNYDEACADAGFDVGGDRVIFDFLTDAYHTWLAMDDDQDDKADELLKPHVDAMAAKFEEANSKYMEQVNMLEGENRALQDQIDQLSKSGSRMSKLDEQIKILEEDRVKFENYNAHLDAKVERSEARAKILAQEIDKIEEELRLAEEERGNLQESVDQQGISVQDIDRMNTERERLQKGVETASERLEDVRKRVADQEADAAGRLDILERTAQDYNTLGYQMGIIPSTARNAKAQNYELEIKVNQGPDFSSSRARKQDTYTETDRLLADAQSGYQPQHLLSLDIKGHVKHSFVALRKEINERKNTAAEADMENKDLLDKTKEALEDKQQEVEGLGHRVRAAEEEFEKTREINNVQKMASDAQIEKLEKELARMRTTMTESIQLMEQREMNTNIEYEQLTIRAAALREELHTEIERMLNDIIKFKVHIQKSLEEYEQFVAEEVEKEIEEQVLEDMQQTGYEEVEEKTEEEEAKLDAYDEDGFRSMIQN